MSYNYQSVPFWDFIRSMDASERPSAGVDQQAFDFQNFAPPPPHHPQGAFGFGPFGPFGHPGFGHGGRGGFGGTGAGACGRGRGSRGQHCHHREGSKERDSSTNDEKHDEKDGEPQDPPRGECPRRGSRHWGHRGHHGRGFGRQGPSTFDLSALLGTFASHPIAQALRDYVQSQQNGENADSEKSFVPPIDIFSTPAAYVLHVALPGAKKEDVGVNWDAEKNELNVAGVVYRQGDEEFLKSLTKVERRIGVFERSVKLPPGAEEKEEVDGDGITAKLEDGVLIVTVPKLEKEWTEVKKVDIE